MNYNIKKTIAGVLLPVFTAGTFASFTGKAFAGGKEGEQYTIIEGQNRYEVDVSKADSKLIELLEKYDTMDNSDDDTEVIVDINELRILEKAGLRVPSKPCNKQADKYGKEAEKILEGKKEWATKAAVRYKLGKAQYDRFSRDEGRFIDIFNSIEDILGYIKNLWAQDKKIKVSITASGETEQRLREDILGLNESLGVQEKVNEAQNGRIETLETRLGEPGEKGVAKGKEEAEKKPSRFWKGLGRYFKGFGQPAKREAFENFARMGYAYSTEGYEDGEPFRDGQSGVFEGNLTAGIGKYGVFSLDMNDVSYSESTFDNNLGKEYITNAAVSASIGFKLKKLLTFLVGANLGKTSVNGEYSGISYETSIDKTAVEARIKAETKPLSVQTRAFYGKEQQNQNTGDAYTGDSESEIYGGDATLTFHLPRGVDVSGGYGAVERNGQFNFSPDYSEKVTDLRQKAGARLEVPICKGISLFGEGAYTNSKSNWDEMEGLEGKIGLEGMLGIGAKW